LRAAPLVLVGYHETGTSWLQAHLFDNTAAGYATAVPERVPLQRLVRPRPLDVDRRVTEMTGLGLSALGHDSPHAWETR
jgi:hypothetical protein